MLTSNEQRVLTKICPMNHRMYAALVDLPLLSTSAQMSAVEKFFAKGGLGVNAPDLVKVRLLGRLTFEAGWVSTYEAGLCSALSSSS